MVAGLDHKVFALAALGVAQLRVIVAQRDAAKRHVARFVLHHIGVHCGGERMLCGIADALKRRQREALDQHLHAQIRHVPAAVGEHILEQRFQTRRDRVDQIEFFVQQARIHLDMARLVHRLRRRIKLGLDVGHHMHQLGRHHQRALLAMHEL